MNPVQLISLLSERESEILDFKQVWHNNNAELVHDILCLLNSLNENNRYLIFGVVNRTNEIVGVNEDPNQKVSADIQDLIRASGFNRIPNFELYNFEHEGKQIDVLEIKNRPEKPYFLTSNKREGGMTVRAGVVYTRLGDTNTPMIESAPEDHIELMWRERFGIDKPPMERMRQLLDDSDMWVYQENSGIDSFYHQIFPEFTIEKSSGSSEDFSEEWCKDKFADAYSSKSSFEFKYSTTVLEKITMVSCDGGRYIFPLPEIEMVKGERKFFCSTESFGFKLARLYQKVFPSGYMSEFVQAYSRRCGVELIYE